jgi:hypothetical protein
MVAHRYSEFDELHEKVWPFNAGFCSVSVIRVVVLVQMKGLLESVQKSVGLPLPKLPGGCCLTVT